MAQKTEKEETEFKVVTESITPCVNNCSVTGNSSTNNMCQTCFNATTSTAASTSLSSPVTSTAGAIKFGEKSPRSSSSKRSSPERTTDPVEIRPDLKGEAEEAASTPAPSALAKREVNRCSGCRRKVGLTGFRCRCGELFCFEHRYSDRHVCSYDYKAAGRETIARENPVVKAAKLVKL